MSDDDWYRQMQKKVWFSPPLQIISRVMRFAYYPRGRGVLEIEHRRLLVQELQFGRHPDSPESVWFLSGLDLDRNARRTYPLDKIADMRFEP